MIDIKRSGYDNLFLVGGYDWHAKFTAKSPDDVEFRAATLSANFDKLDKQDVVLVAKWENEVLHACGMKGKPLPVVAVAKPEVKPPVVKPEVKPPVVKPEVKSEVVKPVPAPTVDAKVETPKSA